MIDSLALTLKTKVDKYRREISVIGYHFILLLPTMFNNAEPLSLLVVLGMNFTMSVFSTSRTSTLNRIH